MRSFHAHASLIYRSLFFLLLRPPPRSTLFPYTSLFRSLLGAVNTNFALLFVLVAWGYGMLLSLWATSTKRDRKSTRLNSSHITISYAVFCLKKKKNIYITGTFIMIDFTIVYFEIVAISS